MQLNMLLDTHKCCSVDGVGLSDLTILTQCALVGLRAIVGAFMALQLVRPIEGLATLSTSEGFLPSVDARVSVQVLVVCRAVWTVLVRTLVLLLQSHIHLGGALQ